MRPTPHPKSYRNRSRGLSPFVATEAPKRVPGPFFRPTLHLNAAGEADRPVAGRDAIGEVWVEGAEVFVGGAASGHQRPGFEAPGMPTTYRISPSKVSYEAFRRQV